MENSPVFFTYNNEDETDNTARAIYECASYLKNNGIGVRLDNTQDNVRQASISDWIDTQLDDASFIVVFINKYYWKQVQSDDPGIVIEISDEQHCLNTIYIYRRLHSKYIGDRSLNFNVLPVVMEDCNLQHVPTWLRDTVIYQWPKHRHNLVARIQKQVNQWPRNLEPIL